MPKAFRTDPDHPAVTYLVRLHADIGGKIKDNQREAAQLREAMKPVEAVIQLYDPAFNVRRISVVPAGDHVPRCTRRAPGGGRAVYGTGDRPSRARWPGRA